MFTKLKAWGAQWFAPRHKEEEPQLPAEKRVIKLSRDLYLPTDEELLAKAERLCGVTVRDVKFLPDEVLVKATYAILTEKACEDVPEGEEVYLEGLTNEGLRLAKKMDGKVYFAKGVF